MSPRRTTRDPSPNELDPHRRAFVRERRSPIPGALLALLFLFPMEAHAQGPAPALDSTWRNWRGPLGTGEAPHATPPLTWSESENVRWKVALPGLGHGSPVIAGDRLFVTSGEAFGESEAPLDAPAPGAHDNARVTRPVRSLALAFDRQTGRHLWTRTLHEGYPHEGGHVTGSHASASPVTDGERLISPSDGCSSRWSGATTAPRASRAASGDG